MQIRIKHREQCALRHMHIEIWKRSVISVLSKRSIGEQCIFICIFIYSYFDPLHTLIVVRECFKGDELSKWMEKANIRPLATPKPLNRSSQKLTGVIMSWIKPGMTNFVTIGSGVSVPQIRDFAVLLGWPVFCSFFGFFNKATAYTPGRIFTKNTSNSA